MVKKIRLRVQGRYGDLSSPLEGVIINVTKEEFIYIQTNDDYVNVDHHLNYEEEFEVCLASDLIYENFFSIDFIEDVLPTHTKQPYIYFDREKKYDHNNKNSYFEQSLVTFNSSDKPKDLNRSYVEKQAFGEEWVLLNEKEMDEYHNKFEHLDPIAYGEDVYVLDGFDIKKFLG